jgi:hypothetical protein
MSNSKEGKGKMSKKKKDDYSKIMPHEGLSPKGLIAYRKENKKVGKNANLHNCRVTPEEWEEKWKKKWEDQPGKMTPSFFKQKFRNEYLQEGFVVKEEENGSHLKEVQSPSLVDSKLWDKLSKWISSWNKRIRVVALSKNSNKK